MTYLLFPLTPIIKFSQIKYDKGDLWEFSLPSCITLHVITRVSIVANGGDGWNIGSIITLVRDTDDKIQLLTQDFSVNCWIDTDEEPEERNFKLTLSRKFNSASSGICWVLSSLINQDFQEVAWTSHYSCLYLGFHLSNDYSSSLLFVFRFLFVSALCHGIHVRFKRC